MSLLVAGAIGASILSGLLDDSDKTAADAARDVAGISALKAYPGQKKIAKELGPYLWENLDTGLTEKEKSLYRGVGKTSILQGVSGARRDVSRRAASQGLRGGSIANILADVEESRIPAFAELETGIMGADIKAKRKRIADLLAFLDLKMGHDPGGEGGKTKIIREYIDKPGYGGGPGVGPAEGPGGLTGQVGNVPGGYATIEGILGDLGLDGIGIGDSSGPGGMEGYGGGDGIGGY